MGSLVTVCMVLYHLLCGLVLEPIFHHFNYLEKSVLSVQKVVA